MPAAACSMNCAQRQTVDAGNRDVGAKPVDDQKAEGEQDALAQFGGLAEAPPSSCLRPFVLLRMPCGVSLYCNNAAETVSRSAAPWKT